MIRSRQFVMVSVRLTVASVVLPLRSVIVTVAVAVLSARICHETVWDPPAATVATVCVEFWGLESRRALLGEKLTTTESPAAADPPVLVTVAVAVKDCPRRMVAGTPLSARLTETGAVAPAGVNWRDADQLPATPAELVARTRHQ
jgi:hypothetical protein